MIKEEITIPRWLLERIEDTLRIQYNINLDKKTGETCQDRNIKESLNGVRKLLKGEELTGGERLERLQPSLPSNLDEAANRQAALEQPYKWEEEQDGSFGVTPLFVMSNIRSSFKAGAEWMSGQGYTTEKTVDRTPFNGPSGICLNLHDSTGFKIGDKVIVQIRKNQ